MVTFFSQSQCIWKQFIKFIHKLESVVECNVDLQEYFPVVLYIMLYKVILTFESVDKMLWCDQSDESHRAIRSNGTNCFLVPSS